MHLNRRAQRPVPNHVASSRPNRETRRRCPPKQASHATGRLNFTRSVAAAFFLGRGKGEAELLLQGSRENAAYRVPLPARRADHLIDRCALGSAQHRNNLVLLRWALRVGVRQRLDRPRRMMRPSRRDRWFADSPLEGTGFELRVPRDSGRAEPISSQAAGMLHYTIMRTRAETWDRCRS